MSAIKVGDLVMVVKPKRCGCVNKIGLIYRVRVIRAGRVGRCVTCGKITFPNGTIISDRQDSTDELTHLIKIDPPAIPESIERTEEIPA